MSLFLLDEDKSRPHSRELWHFSQVDIRALVQLTYAGVFPVNRGMQSTIHQIVTDRYIDTKQSASIHVSKSIVHNLYDTYGGKKKTCALLHEKAWDQINVLIGSKHSNQSSSNDGSRRSTL